MIPAQQCADFALSELLKKQPLSEGKVQFAWAASVGSAIARATSVSLRSDGTLLVRAVDEHWRLETIRCEPTIRKRLRQLLGTTVVKVIDVTR
ncbi:MAG: DciA family protein [Vicinamibacterales bacterium]